MMLTPDKVTISICSGNNEVFRLVGGRVGNTYVDPDGCLCLLSASPSPGSTVMVAQLGRSPWWYSLLGETLSVCNTCNGY